MNELSRLKWQCRRGSRELDLLLQRYLDTQYPMADSAEKRKFIAMLKLNDSDLMQQLKTIQKI